MGVHVGHVVHVVPADLPALAAWLGSRVCVCVRVRAIVRVFVSDYKVNVS